MQIKLQPGAKMPQRMTKHAAGYDLCANESVMIPHGCHAKIATGVHFDIENGTVGTISHRSGMNTKQGIQAYGRVDADYQGEVFVTLFNCDSSRPVIIEKGDRIAQIVFTEYRVVSFEVVEEFAFKTERGGDGFGSTGR